MKFDPDQPVARERLARLAFETRRYEEASEPLMQATELKPDDPFPHLCLGVLNMEFLGDSRTAAQHLRKYQELGGEDERASEWLRRRVR